MTPKYWFTGGRRATDEGILRPQVQSSTSLKSLQKASGVPARNKNKKRLILSQTMVIDVDPNKVLLLSLLFSSSF